MRRRDATTAARRPARRPAPTGDGRGGTGRRRSRGSLRRVGRAFWGGRVISRTNRRGAAWRAAARPPADAPGAVHRPWRPNSGGGGEGLLLARSMAFSIGRGAC